MDDFIKDAFKDELANITQQFRYTKEDVRIPSTLPTSYGTEKSGKLIDFYNSNENLAPQGSAEWLKARSTYIGGSEVGAVTGNNKYMKLKDLVLSKAGIKPFKQNHFMLWGTMFEQILRRTVEKIYNIGILETGSIRGNYGNAYSPDGLAYHPKEDKLILYEFKCPFSREPDGEVPPHYKDQVLLGLDTIDICDEGRYIEATIRRCSLEDIGFNTLYDKQLHNDFEYKTPIAYGFIGFFAIDEYTFSPRDMGACEKNVFIQIMYRAIAGDIDYFQFDPIVNPKVSQEQSKITFFDQLNKFYKFCHTRDLAVVGILPYKIFPFNVHRIQRVPDFAKNLEPKFRDVLAQVKDILEKAEMEKNIEPVQKRTYRKRTYK